MLEQIKSEIGNTPVKVEYIGGKVKCGVIIDHIEKSLSDIGNWKFITFNNLLAYELTEDPSLIEKLEENSIVSIDMMLR